MKKIWIAPHDNSIGGSLCMLPFLKYWVDRDGAIEFGPSISSWVSQALPSNYVLNPSLASSDADYVIDGKGWGYVVMNGKGTMHLANGIARQAGLHEELPLTFPFEIQPIQGNVDIVIAPFGSKEATSRVWPIDKWILVIGILSKYYQVTVIGTSKDDYSWCENCNLLIDKPLTYIAAILDKCKLFVSIDSGPANLATLLGIKNHVLLYPHNCQITANPYATKVRVSKDWPNIIHIPVQPVVDACLKCLEEQECTMKT